MKHTPLIKLLAVGAVSAVALSTALAQTHDQGNDHRRPRPASTAMSRHERQHDQHEHARWHRHDHDLHAGHRVHRGAHDDQREPVRYYYTKNTTVVDSTGAPVDMALLRSDLPVRYSYVKEGDRMVISKITVQKPLAEITKDRDHDDHHDPQVTCRFGQSTRQSIQKRPRNVFPRAFSFVAAVYDRRDRDSRS